MSSVGMKLISSILTVGSLKDFYKLNIDLKTFKPVEGECWEFINDFVAKHNVLPKVKTLKNELEGIILVKVVEPPSYYANQIKERYVSESIIKGFKDTRPHLEHGSINIEKAVGSLTSTLLKINAINNGTRAIDFRDISDLIITEYKRKKNEGLNSSILMGYPTVDNLSGGLVGGDVVSIVGRPATGKTFNTLYTAHNAWNKQNKSVMFVSMEMNIIAIGQRLASMHTKKNLTQIKKARLATKSYNRMVTQLEKVKDSDSPFWLIDGNMSSSVEEIWKLAQQFNPEFIVIDGAYLLRHPNSRLSKWDRVAENTEMIKHALAANLDIPVLCSWQFNREASKKIKKASATDTIGLEDIGYSDVIGQISSLVLGMMEEDSVETVLKRKISILKGRNGEIGSFYINWDFFFMNFSEIIEYTSNNESYSKYDKSIDGLSKKKQKGLIHQ